MLETKMPHLLGPRRQGLRRATDQSLTPNGRCHLSIVAAADKRRDLLENASCLYIIECRPLSLRAYAKAREL
ncbi:unnamed protein product [Protopolystoma xenopodis]|uniref:Uncharacterized protein n=1 Tax=Protopolystoma xenopodis TaxID=117903 RepID=A0A448WQM6_9PLAT|nr:unnamed protein product [Protopolystoma xenopodis]